jgi:hypothetical protein
VPINDSTLTSVTDYDRDAISMNYILNKTDEINHGLNIAMLDACRTPIGRGGSGSIQNIGAEGIYLVYSTASGATASDSGQFRRSFLKYAKQPLKLTDIFGAVKLDLRKEGQRPSIQDDAVGVFYFSKPNPKPVVTPTPPPKPQIVERIVYRDRPQNTASTTQSSSKWITPKDSVSRSNGGKIDKEGICRAKWKNAKEICSASGGRLPNREELKKIVTDCGGVLRSLENNKKNSSYQSCYKAKGFTSSYYWSSTTNASDSSSAWGVYFDCGDDGRGSKTDENLVRCVRGGH